MSLDLWLESGDAEFDSFNYTHNVTPTWRLVGAFEALYESNGQWAGDVLPALEAAVVRMLCMMPECRALNPPNKWGDADGAFRFLCEWTAACRARPDATIRVSR